MEKQYFIYISANKPGGTLYNGKIYYRATMKRRLSPSRGRERYFIR